MRNSERTPWARTRLRWASLLPLVMATMLVGGTAALAGQDGAVGGLPQYHSESLFMVDVPGASNSLAAGLFNPAAWSLRPNGGLYFAWNDPEEGQPAAAERSDWVGIASLRGLAFGVRSFRFEDAGDNEWHWEEYTIGLGGASRSGGLGASYSWSDGPDCAATRHKRLTVGHISRWRPVSFGLATAFDLEGSADDRDYAVQADLGVRPLDPRVTLFADAVWESGQDFEEIRTGYGFEVHPLRGVAIGAKGLNTGEWSFRVSIGLSPGSHPAGSVHLDNDGEHRASTYSVETQSVAPDLGLLGRREHYPEIDLKGPMVYRRFKYFDDRRTLMGTMRQLDRYATDPSIGGVVLNLSGMRIGSEMLWELREQLAGLRAHGKKVIVYFDYASMSSYLLATVADQIWIDPEGIIEIPGIAGGRTYLSDALAKVGVGFEEWRFFTYKSAMETFSRNSLSDADREQFSAVIDDIYEVIAADACQARGLARAEWDRLINEKALLIPREAQEAGLVDSIGTFEQAKDAARDAAPRTTADASAAPLGRLLGDPIWSGMEWGARPRIAVLYAIGPCAMDEGIKGRLLSKKIKEAREDGRVKAVVLRADSPGGSALASDLVAREMLETSKQKPMIVSQGAVAGSGGYWISMYADTIVAAPTTITGSIGVIGGWFWDDGLGEKLGITWDGIWRGDHADLGRGMQLPLLGLRIPERNLTDGERERMEYLIRDTYDVFVGKVAEGRELTEDEVDRVGQGRIWSGIDARELDLVDEMGGLWYTLAMAKEVAGVPDTRPVTITEGPSIGAFNLSFLKPSFFGFLGLGGEQDNEAAQALPSIWDAGGYPMTRVSPEDLLTAGERAYLQMLLRNQGRPVTMMPPLQILDGAE